jgi:hypothetical protein
LLKSESPAVDRHAMMVSIDTHARTRASAMRDGPAKTARDARKFGALEMKRVLGGSLLSLAATTGLFGLPGCGGSEGSPNASAGAPSPAPAPAPTPEPPPAPPPAGTYTVTVSWSRPLLNTDGTVLTDLSGYRIHYGTSAADLSQSVMVSGAEATSGVVSGLAPGSYYFAVTTVNSAGTASDLSNSASRTVP